MNNFRIRVWHKKFKQIYESIDNAAYSSHPYWTTLIELFQDETLDKDNNTFDDLSISQLRPYFDNKAKFFTKDKLSAIKYYLSENENDASILERTDEEILAEYDTKEYEDDLYSIDLGQEDKYKVIVDSEDDMVGIVVVKLEEA